MGEINGTLKAPIERASHGGSPISVNPVTGSPYSMPTPLMPPLVTPHTMLPSMATSDPFQLTFSSYFWSPFLCSLSYFLSPFLRFSLLLSVLPFRFLSPFPFHYHAYLSSPVSFLFLFVFLLLIAPLSPVYAASSPSHGLSFFSLNANGLYSVIKMNVIKDYVVLSHPHVWVINETKSFSPVASCVSVPSYNMYETPALCCSACSSKWGVVATVWNDLHSQCIPVPDGLAGRVIALDIIISTASACRFILCILTVYAPWDPGGPQPTPSQFWPMVAQLCHDAPSKSWCIIGDCNLTLASIKTANPLPSPNPNCGPYLAFLRDAHSCDLWLAQDNYSAFSHYTYSHGPTSPSSTTSSAHMLTSWMALLTFPLSTLVPLTTGQSVPQSCCHT